LWGILLTSEPKVLNAVEHSSSAGLRGERFLLLWPTTKRRWWTATPLGIMLSLTDMAAGIFLGVSLCRSALRLAFVCAEAHEPLVRGR